MKTNTKALQRFMTASVLAVMVCIAVLPVTAHAAITDWLVPWSVDEICVVTQEPHAGHSTDANGNAFDFASGGKNIQLFAPTGGRIEVCAEQPTGYGRHVKIRTDDGLTLIMAHFEQIDSRWQYESRIERGEYIGLMGTTGNSTGVHLHFEIIAGSKQEAERLLWTAFGKSVDELRINSIVRGDVGLVPNPWGGLDDDDPPAQDPVITDPSDSEPDPVASVLTYPEGISTAALLSSLSANEYSLYRTDSTKLSSQQLVGTGNYLLVSPGGTSEQFAIVVYGDANGDGKIDLRDASLLLRTFVGLEADLKMPYNEAADVNHDGAISLKDCQRILRYIVGLESIQ